RVVSARDRRGRELSLTAKGKRVLLALQPVVEDLQKDILEPLSAHERESFIQLARQVVLHSMTP
ncbi:MAG: MarR family transcriptional regulator, partial [Limnohabitans sp.]